MSELENKEALESEEVIQGPEDTKKHRSKKNRNMLFLFLFCALVGGGGAIYLTAPKEVTTQQASSDLDRRLEKAAGQSSHPSLANRRDYGQDFANKVEGEVDGISSEVSGIKSETESTNAQLTQLSTDFARFLEKYQQDQQARQDRDEDLQIVLDAQAQKQQEIESMYNSKSGFPEPITAEPKASTPVFTGGQPRPMPQLPIKEVERTEFKLAPIQATSKAVNLRDSTSYIPAGAYAPGRIIMGAKTSAAVDAQSDPRPILIRVRGKAKGPKINGQHTETELDGCTITASAYGDISSEQGHAKLQEMSCATGPNEFKTVRVYGYIGHRGSYGVHSNVVMREGDLTQRAFWAGMLANTGESFGLLVGETSKSAVGTVNTASGAGDAALNMFTGGLEESSQQLSSYYIKRLEQIQPVIPLKAGTPVDIVFMKEVSMDQIEEKESTANGERQRIPLDSENSDVAPNAINQQVLHLLQKQANPAPNKTDWNNEFY